MAVGATRVGIDFGTSSTVAVLALPGREPRPLLFDGSPLLPSAVGLDPTGKLIVGRDALHAAIASPGAVERYPKRCVDDGTVLLGDRELPVVEVFAAVLRRVIDEAARSAGASPDEVVVTHPAAWGRQRRDTLRAAASAGVATVRLVSEPVAAAHHLAGVAGERIPDGGTAVVYDFGAGTFDATVIRRAGDRFDVLATQGRPDSGGLDIDAAIVVHLAGAAPDPELWQRLDSPVTAGDRRARQQLWENVRTGKESLARASSTLVHLPLFDLEVPLGREELDQLAASVLANTVDTTRAVLELAGVSPETIFLVGGASRMSAVSGALHRAFGVEPVTVDQPELAVAEGSLLAGAAASPDTDDWPALAALPAPPTATRRVRIRLLAGAAAVTALLVGSAIANASRGRSPSPAPSSASASASASVEPVPWIDPCLLGTWRMTNQSLYGLIGGVKVQYSGSAGTITVVRADGTLTIDETNAAPDVAIYHGDRYESRHRGGAVMRYSADTGTHLLQIAVISSDSYNVLYRNGKVNAEAPGSWPLEAVQYQCTETSLIETSSLGNWSADAVRVT